MASNDQHYGGDSESEDDFNPAPADMSDEENDAENDRGGRTSSPAADDDDEDAGRSNGASKRPQNDDEEEGDEDEDAEGGGEDLDEEEEEEEEDEDDEDDVQGVSRVSRSFMRSAIPRQRLSGAPCPSAAAACCYAASFEHNC